LNSASARPGLRLPPIATAIVASVLVLTPLLAMASLSPVAVGLSGAALVLIIALLWRADEPPILLVPVLFQWSEVATLPIATVWRQVPLDSMSYLEGNLEVSAAYGLAGVTALAVGLRLGSAGGALRPFAHRLQVEARALRLDQVLKIGLGAMALGYMLSTLSGSAGPARELLGNAAGVKHVGLFVIAYWCLVNERNYGLLAAVAAFEIIIGMTGFFAEFKNGVLTLLVAVMAARPRLRASDLAAAAIMGSLILFVATFWTAIKVDYRALVNAGTGAQVVEVPLDERLAHIARAFGDLDGATLADSFELLVDRHGYIGYLALVMQNVPAYVPHEDGKLTLGVISHITMPRIFFPDKPPLPSDTDVMKQYTGLTDTWNENTSISIGNLGELYVDFGLIGGLMAELVIGLMAGLVYRTLRKNSRCPAIVTAGLCVMIALPLAYFGTAYVKLIGSFVFTSVIAVLLQRIVAPALFAARGAPGGQSAGMLR